VYLSHYIVVLRLLIDSLADSTQGITYNMLLSAKKYLTCI